MADQSGMCSIVLSTMTRDGKLAPGSTGMRGGSTARSTASAEAWPSATVRVGVAVARAAPPVKSQAEQAHARCSTMASNTGCTSVGELLITRRMSAVAVWWLKRLLRLVEQPRVLQRDADVGRDRGQQPLVVGVVRALDLACSGR